MAKSQMPWNIILDIVCFILLGFADLLFHIIPIEPSHRGFFCDDQTLQKPFQKETISTWLTLLVGLLVSIPVITICEAVNPKSKEGKNELAFSSTVDKITIKCGPIKWKPSQWQRRAIFIVFIYGFGALVTNLFTDIGKTTVGQLRPYFLAVCKPNNCSQGFVTGDVCTGNPVDIWEARTSFPSAHASFSAYSMVFLALYLESSMPTKRSNLVKPLIQVAFISLGVLCALSRIFDYWHHWGDVLVGLCLGTIVAFFITFRSLRLFSVRQCPKCDFIDDVDNSKNGPACQSKEEGGPLANSTLPI